MVEPLSDVPTLDTSQSDSMKWVSVLSTRPSLEAALAEVVDAAESILATPADLGFLFISLTFASEYPRLIPLLKERLAIPALIGCGGAGIIGTDKNGQPQEIEGLPALSLTLARLPKGTVRTFHLRADDLPDLDSSPSHWVDVVGVDPAEDPHFILLSDPFSSKVNDLIQGLDFAYPGSVKVGGLANGDSSNGSVLFHDYQIHREGTVGIALTGNVTIETIVAQGCRPIGPIFQITQGERNVLLGLQQQDQDGNWVGKPRPPLELLREVVQELNEDDRVLAQHSLFIGIARNGFQQNLDYGDFLIRNLLGVDPRVGAIAIGDRVRTGQRIQFHLRDAHTSEGDLETLLAGYERRHYSQPNAHGALMFTCLGRGEGLYGQPNFDSQLFRRYQTDVPLSGFFCNGEIGPIGGNTFLHGYTSVFAICRQR